MGCQQKLHRKTKIAFINESYHEYAHLSKIITNILNVIIQKLYSAVT